MGYLNELGFSNEMIDVIVNSIPKQAREVLERKSDVVKSNIDYLKSLGVTNYVTAFIKFYNMFLLDTESFDEIFSKYDRDDLVVKLEKNVAIMEYL